LIKKEIVYPPNKVHYRTMDFVPTRKQEILIKNRVIRHRNKLVR